MDRKPPLPTLKKRPPLELAAQTASTSYRTILSPAILAQALRTRLVPTTFEPHLYTLLEEAPASLLDKLVEQIRAEDGVSREQIWDNLRAVARDLRVMRDLFG